MVNGNSNMAGHDRDRCTVVQKPEVEHNNRKSRQRSAAVQHEPAAPALDDQREILVSF